MRFSQLCLGFLLLAYGVSLFAGTLPRINLAGPFVCASVGAWLLVGPVRVSKERERRLERYKAFLRSNPLRQRRVAAANRAARLGYVLIACAIAWIAVSSRSPDWLWPAIGFGLQAIPGLGLLGYQQIVIAKAEIAAVAADDGETSV